MLNAQICTYPKRYASMYAYAKKNIKRVPLDMQKTDYEKLSNAAIATGMSVNGYIKQAIAEKMEREKESN